MKIEKKDNVDRFLQKLNKSGFRILDIKEDKHRNQHHFPCS
ncbi:hypothetical protein KP78_31910 [Jeotgalibacillus soli]|uniref:Uncharacterized protein n=1 Tax=Jeotgalibacillus soli TaxID=889306 RepID=A0A0C2V5D9_9BACL|nr:hypothetical protein KP78_31910 [Jeotgalibacillus soli]